MEQQVKKKKPARRQPEQVREAAQARHEARQQKAAQRVQQQAEQQAERQAQPPGDAVSPVGGRPTLPPGEQHLHPVTVRLDARQYEQLSAYTAPSGRTLAAIVRAALAGIPQFTIEEHAWLRQVADLTNATTEVVRQLAGNEPAAAAEWAALAGRLDAFLNGLHH